MQQARVSDLRGRRGTFPVDVVCAVSGALALLVSGWVHFFLYFRGGYRGIAPDAFAGLTISRSFLLQAFSAVVVAELLVVGLAVRRILVPAALAGIALAGGSLLAYFLSRTVGLLGFTETSTTTEGVVAIVAEVTAVAVLGLLVGRSVRRGEARRAGARVAAVD
jgi:hypothetical protein